MSNQKASGSQCIVNGKTHYQRNKAKYTERNKVQRAEMRAYIQELKNKPCMDCGESFPYYVMDFDHTADDKAINVSSAIADRWSKDRVTAEIAKCDLVCSNCHKERTARRSGYSTTVRTPIRKGTRL